MARDKIRPVSDIGIHPVSGALGAEVSGVDLAKDLDDQTLGLLRSAWLEHLVLFFRDQPLTPDRFLAFARRFGEIIEYPFVKGLEEHPEIIPVVKLSTNESISVASGTPTPRTST